MAQDGKHDADKAEPITIKKYANRRLYNTATSSYVTLDHLCHMVQEGVDFVVYDAKTGEDITRSVLTQIIVEEEAKGQNLLPISFLRQLISFYGHSLQWMVPRYLENMMETFTSNQEKMRQSMQETFGGMFPFGRLEEMGKQNLAMMESAMRMFSPLGQEGTRSDTVDQDKQSSSAGKNEEEREEQNLEQLKAQVDALQKQIDDLRRNQS